MAKRNLVEPWTAGPLRRDGIAELANSSGRIVRYVLSDPSVGRDGHTIAANAWVLDNYLRNPVVLWAHDSFEPPIGRMIEIGTSGNRLMGSVEYPDPETYPFADTIFRLVKGGYLNAMSASWLPLEWSYSQDRARPGGIDFKRVEMLEASQVPVPALPTALVTARAAGIDTGPLYEWAERVLDTRGPDPELIELRKAARMPTPRKRADATKPEGDYGDVKYADPGYQDDKKPRYPIDTVEHIKAAWNYINQEKNESQYSAEQVAHIKSAIIAAWKEKIDPDGPPSARSFIDKLTRDLGDCAWLAQMLGALSYLADCSEFEAEDEGDNSSIPARLAAVVNALGKILVDMTAEEVGELLGEDMLRDAGTAGQRALRAFGRAFAAKPTTAPEEAAVVRIGTDAARIVADALTRAGKVLSAENEATLRAAHDHMTRACDMVRGVCDRATPIAEEADEPDDMGEMEMDDDLTRARKKVAELRRSAA